MPTFGALLLALAAARARQALCLQAHAESDAADALPKEPVRLEDGSLEFTAMLGIPENFKEPQSKVVGWQLIHGDDDTVAATISKVRAEGSIAKWNKAHPKHKVMPGDRIIKVNNIPWHNNTAAFIEHVGRQIHAVSERMENAPRRLYVKVQRPAATVPVTKLADGSLEFTALLKIPKSSKEPQSKLMGWSLTHGDDDHVPATISKIRNRGTIANWNKDYPTQKIMPGDKIMKVNKLPWHNNTKLFVKHMGRRIEAATRRKAGAEHHLYLKVQRTAEGAKEASKEESEEDSSEEDTKEESKEDSEESKEESNEDSGEESENM